jgi:hypothetical protein
VPKMVVFITLMFFGHLNIVLNCLVTAEKACLIILLSVGIGDFVQFMIEARGISIIAAIFHVQISTSL